MSVVLLQKTTVLINISALFVYCFLKLLINHHLIEYILSLTYIYCICSVKNMLRYHSFPSLYNMALRSLVEWKDFDIQHFATSPDFVKDDLLRVALARGKCKDNVSYFLHPNIIKLSINECKITCKELDNICKCVKLKVLEMNAVRYHRFNHPSSSLKKMFSQLHCLVKLHIQRNDGMTDGVAAELAQSCPNLQELDVSGCINLSNEGIYSLSTLSLLKAANLSDTSISDPALNALGSGHCSLSLAELKLNNCTLITDEGISALIQGCKKLCILVFCGCPKVSVDCQLSLDSFLGSNKKSKLVTWTVYF